MILSRPARYAILFTVACTLAACGGGKGSSAPPPTGVVVSAGDQEVEVAWDALPGVEYWVFIGPPGTTPENFSNIAGAYPATKVTPPYGFYAITINGAFQALTNGKSYDVTINARTNGGPGGPSSAPQRVSPRATSTSWQTGASLVSSVDGVADPVYGGAYGLPLYAANNTLNYTGNPADFVFVGRNGSAWYSTQDPQGQTFTFQPVSSGIATGNDLTSIGYASAFGFLAVGTNGVSSFSYDGITWTPQNSSTTRNFRAIATTAANGFIAVGDGCMVNAVGTGGTTQGSVWVDYTAGFTASSTYTAACASATPPSLRTAGAEGGYFMVGGTQGTLAFSASYYTTAGNWWPVVSTLPAGVTGSSVTINGLLYGTVYEDTTTPGAYTATPLWLAVGGYTDSGGAQHPLILYTTTGPTLSGSTYSWTTWAAATLPAGLTGSLHAVSAASDPVTGGLTQLVAVGDNGLILYDQLETPITYNGTVLPSITDTPAQSWTQAPAVTGNALYSMVHGNYGLQAAGAAGTRLFTY